MHQIAFRSFPLFFCAMTVLQGCSFVNLSFLVGSATGVQAITPIPEVSETKNSPQIRSAELRLKALIQGLARPTSELQLRIQAGDVVHLFPLEKFTQEQFQSILQQTPGPLPLTIALLGPDQSLISTLSLDLTLQEGTPTDVLFSLSPSADLQLVRVENSPVVIPIATSPSPTLATPPSAAPLGGGSGDKLPTPGFIPRVLTTGNDYLTLIWDPPAGPEPSSYKILRNGQEVATTTHPVRTTTISNLTSGTEYTFAIIAVYADGSEVPSESLITRLSASSGGGGGGGGGGGSTPITDPAPVITTLTATETNLAGTGYPVELTVTATDNQPLSNSAYTWSCLDCPDPQTHFSSAQGPTVVWTAPDTPGTYTLQVSVSDGVNPPTSQTQTITVSHFKVDVDITGDYQ